MNTSLSANGRRSVVRLLVLFSVLFLTLGGALATARPACGCASKAKLDMTSLADFAGKLRKIASEHGLGGVVAGLAASPSTNAAQLFQNLVRQGLISVDYADKLAGSSGTKGGSEAWDHGVPNTTDHCIFTFPNDPMVLASRLAEKQETGHVIACYNRHWFSKYPEDGVAMLMTGWKEPRLVKPRDFEEVVGVPYSSRLEDLLSTPAFADIPAE